METSYPFNVEEFYTNCFRIGYVTLTDTEVAALIHFLREEDDNPAIYDSSLEERYPDIYKKFDDAAIPLMDEMEALRTGEEIEEVGMYQAYLPESIITEALGEDYRW